MPWTQVLNDVTSRLSAASQNIQTSDPYHYTYSSPSTFSVEQACSPTYSDSQSSSMSVRVQLDQQNAPFYTNLDFVTGRVILNLSAETAITAINVKLEGESKTRLSGPKFQNDPRNRQKIELELHKLLYKVQTVFPTSSTAQDSFNTQYTLSPGQYTYPFSLKIPVNNDCVNNTNVFQDLRLGPLLVADLTNARHVKQTLPPPLSGFPGLAEIKYFIKATVVRPKFYQENLRATIDFAFQPVEPPRPAVRHEETYARRLHQFQPVSPTTPKTSKSTFFKKTVTAQPEEQSPLAIKVEARLPSPTIISCNQPLPLRLLVEKTNDSTASVFLSVLQIELIGTTKITAHGLTRVETGSWVLMSQANMKFQLDSPNDQTIRSFQIPARFWDSIPLPNTVVPSFKTCNITRTYEVEVRVGVTHGSVDGARPELIVLPLRLPVEVFSDVKPPAQLLNRINTNEASSSTLSPPRPNHNQYQHSPITPTQDSTPVQTGSYIPPLEDSADDPPPSYEDAIAEDIAPVDGPRRDSPALGQNLTGSTQQSSNSDSKYSSGLNRHPSERLFSQNAPSPPPVSTTSTGAQPTKDEHSTNATVTTATTNLLAGLNMDDNGIPIDRRPPPLPARKGTTESISGQKKPS